MTEDRASYTATDEGYAWCPPDAVSDSVKAEAARLVAQLSAALVPAPPRVVGEWLARLGVLVAGNMPAADAKLRVAAYAADLAFPAICYTDSTRQKAAREFKWFPSFAELFAFLETIAEPQRAKLHRVRVIAGLPVKRESRDPGWSSLTEEEKQAHRDMMAKVKAQLSNARPLSTES